MRRHTPLFVMACLLAVWGCDRHNGSVSGRVAVTQPMNPSDTLKRTTVTLVRLTPAFRTRLDELCRRYATDVAPHDKEADIHQSAARSLEAAGRLPESIAESQKAITAMELSLHGSRVFLAQIDSAVATVRVAERSTNPQGGFRFDSLATGRYALTGEARVGSARVDLWSEFNLARGAREERLLGDAQVTEDRWCRKGAAAGT